MVSVNVLAIVVALAAAIPSAICGFGVWLIERRISKRDKLAEEKHKKEQEELEKREKTRQENEFMTLKSVGAALALAEATAKAVQRIPDAKCNGDMHAALEYAAKIKHEQKDFIERIGIQTIYREGA